METETKICSKCNKNLSLDAFNSRRCGTYLKRCKDCNYEKKCEHNVFFASGVLLTITGSYLI